MIEMQDLQQAWRGLEQRLARQETELLRARARRTLDSARARLRLVSAGLWLQLVVGAMVVLWAGGYWFDHLGQAHLVAYGIGLHLYGIGLLASSALQLVRLSQVDYDAPVLEVQRRVLALRRSRVACERLLLIAGGVAWVPLVFIALASVGLDVWLRSPDMVLWNLAAGVGLAALAAWLTHRFRAWFERDATGRGLREAEAELAALGGTEATD